MVGNIKHLNDASERAFFHFLELGKEKPDCHSGSRVFDL